MLTIPEPLIARLEASAKAARELQIIHDLLSPVRLADDEARMSWQGWQSDGNIRQQLTQILATSPYHALWTRFCADHDLAFPGRPGGYYFARRMDIRLANIRQRLADPAAPDPAPHTRAEDLPALETIASLLGFIQDGAVQMREQGGLYLNRINYAAQAPDQHAIRHLLVAYSQSQIAHSEVTWI